MAISLAFPKIEINLNEHEFPRSVAKHLWPIIHASLWWLMGNFFSLIRKSGDGEKCQARGEAGNKVSKIRSEKRTERTRVLWFHAWRCLDLWSPNNVIGSWSGPYGDVEIPLDNNRRYMCSRARSSAVVQSCFPSSRNETRKKSENIIIKLITILTDKH